MGPNGQCGGITCKAMTSCAWSYVAPIRIVSASGIYGSGGQQLEDAQQLECQWGGAAFAHALLQEPAGEDDSAGCDSEARRLEGPNEAPAAPESRCAAAVIATWHWASAVVATAHPQAIPPQAGGHWQAPSRRSETGEQHTGTQDLGANKKQGRGTPVPRALRGRHGFPDTGTDTVALSHELTIGAPETNFASLTYHSGSIMTAAVPVYPIYYGNWTGDKGQSIIQTFVNSITNTTVDGLVRCPH